MLPPLAEELGQRLSRAGEEYQRRARRWEPCSVPLPVTLSLLGNTLWEALIHMLILFI